MDGVLNNYVAKEYIMKIVVKEEAANESAG